MPDSCDKVRALSAHRVETNRRIHRGPNPARLVLWRLDIAGEVRGTTHHYRDPRYPWRISSAIAAELARYLDFAEPHRATLPAGSHESSTPRAADATVLPAQNPKNEPG